MRWLDGISITQTQWTWVWVNSRSWWWTGRPSMLQFMGSQRVGHDWATELNWLVPWRHAPVHFQSRSKMCRTSTETESCSFLSSPCPLSKPITQASAPAEKSLAVPQTVKHGITIWPSNSTPRYIPQRNENKYSNKYLSKNVSNSKGWKQPKCLSMDE